MDAASGMAWSVMVKDSWSWPDCVPCRDWVLRGLRGVPRQMVELSTTRHIASVKVPSKIQEMPSKAAACGRWGLFPGGGVAFSEGPCDGEFA
jgi:hypothetical protein